MTKTLNLITEYAGKIKPDSIEEYVSVGGFEALKIAMGKSPIESIEEIKKSKLQGRGGAAYPTGVKWEQAYQIQKNPKYIICNADEGEPGTFKDKVILDHLPLMLIEGMTIAAYILNSPKGFIYIRGEYPESQKIVARAIKAAKERGFLGSDILGTKFSFDIEIISGAGAYVCGENSALVESTEGNSGRPRMKPPFIKNHGYMGMPTLVNNVETFAYVPYILKEGGEKFASYGTEFSGGTKLVCLSGNLVNKGVFEVPFGITLRELIYDIGGGIPDGRKLKFVQLGGSSGPCIPEEMLDTKLCYKELKSKGLTLGSGAILVVDDSNCAVDFLKCVTEFFYHESCGKCTPCREGNKQLLALVNKFANGNATENDLQIIKKVGYIMKNAAFCGLGETAPTAHLSLIKYFEDEFVEHINKKCRANVCNFGGVEND
ncbi:NADP-reducing hydrogenase subunit HndC [Caloramator mitchellensis]|uniref:NADP-reducing hydrogenase subunit HndC n=1 Tax=Caloramator mitchellensis TaxID=908809 RepID=A0A0R3K4W7_CALMK|nr:NADH-ubiquinone oxidoreductase-F iron-sulfur binding region domain-containing protein [Caloramator mitchellensis]KRQ87407.1 NADP-reducing hydrogenase subunit HndC [Caloramator mitchellensis]